MDQTISRLLRNPIALTVIRLMMVVPLFLAGFNKLFAFEGAANYLANGSALMTMPFPSLLLVLVIILEIGAPVLVVLNRWFAVYASIILAGFAVFAGVFYHWFAADFASLGTDMDQIVAMKNFAWAGGLLALAALAKRD